MIQNLHRGLLNRLHMSQCDCHLYICIPAITIWGGVGGVGGGDDICRSKCTHRLSCVAECKQREQRLVIRLQNASRRAVFEHMRAWRLAQQGMW